MANWIEEFTYLKKTVPTATWFEIAGEGRRRYLAWRLSPTASMFIQFSNDDPTPDITGDGGDLFVPSEKFYWDAAVMPTSRIWAFQTSGGDADIFIADVQA